MLKIKLVTNKCFKNKLLFFNNCTVLFLIIIKFKVWFFKFSIKL